MFAEPQNKPKPPGEKRALNVCDPLSNIVHICPLFFCRVLNAVRTTISVVGSQMQNGIFALSVLNTTVRYYHRASVNVG